MFTFCDSPFNIVHIHANGDVSPCLCRAWHNFGVVGNLKLNTLEEIFNNDKMQHFRQTIIDQAYTYCSKGTCGKLWNLDQVDQLPTAIGPRLPSIVYLQDLDYSCNLKCPSCRLGPIYSKSVNPDARFILNAIKDAYRDSENTVMLCGDGQGEMLASSAYLEFFKSPDLPRCIRIGMNSNGNLLLKRMDLLESLHQRGQIASIAICFDAASAKTYKKIRGGKFDIVLEGVKKAISLGINVTAQMVVQYGNYREILDYRDMCLDLGVVFTGLQKINRWKHISQAWWQMNNIEDNADVDYDFLVSALEEFKRTPNSSICGGLETIIAKKKSSAMQFHRPAKLEI